MIMVIRARINGMVFMFERWVAFKMSRGNDERFFAGDSDSELVRVYLAMHANRPIAGYCICKGPFMGQNS